MKDGLFGASFGELDHRTAKRPDGMRVAYKNTIVADHVTLWKS